MPAPAFYGISFMALYLVVIAEVYFLHRWRGQPMNWREVAVNMNSGQAVLWLLQGLRVWAYVQVYDHLSFGFLAGLPAVLLLPLAFLLWDLAFYSSHRAHHHFPLLWDVHAVHHQGEAFNISLAVRNAWLQVLTPTPFFLVLAVIGVPPAVFLSVGALHYTVQLYNHNGVFLRPSFLDLFMVTPRHHRVHHAKHPDYRDRNFGSALVIWDRLFGTFAAERPALPVDIGLDDPPRTDNALWLNLEPLSRRLGWPAAPAVGAPVRVDAGWLVAGSLLEFLLLSLYILTVDHLPLAARAALIAFVIGGTILLGAAADGDRRAVQAWALLAAGGAAAGLWGQGSLGLFGAGLLVLGLLHGLLGLGALRRPIAPAAH